MTNVECYPFFSKVSKTAFQKSQQFFYSNNIQTNVFNDKGKAIDISAFQSSHHFSNKSAAPSWVVYDKQVLSFDGLSSETVTERLDESERIHRCKIYYFLEDGTMKVTEPKEDNSGMEQGYNFKILNIIFFYLGRTKLIKKKISSVCICY